jgi:tetratricopeptide (TPR) repeat protein
MRRVLVSLVIVSSLAAPSAVRAQDGVGFRAAIGPDTVYVGQQASYTLTVTIPGEVRQRLRRNPVFIPPEARAMLAYELPMQKSDPTREGSETHVFRRALFPLTPGRFQINPSQLSYSLPQSPSFFSREEDRLLRSEGVTLVAIEPPRSGRPAQWAGAVGRWRASTRVEGNARVGDPLVLTLRLEGTGNATLLPRPALSIPWANVVAEDERVVLDSTPTTLGGRKEFAWLVTPREAGARQIPAMEYHYFDPIARVYTTAVSAPITLRVANGDLVEMPTRAAAAAAAVPLTLRPQLQGATRLRLPFWWAWLLIVLAAPLPWLLTAMRRRSPRAPRVKSAAERIEDPKETLQGGDLRSLYAAALAARTGVRLDRATSPGALASALKREGVTDETARDAEALRDLLDRTAYAKGARGSDLRERVKGVLKRVTDEARAQMARTLLLLLLTSAALLAAPAPAWAQQSTAETLRAFTEGQTAYTGRDYARARDAFLEAARSAPRDPAAWANLGTAAWEAGDTASAVLGWQRALRLDPLAGDLRPRLERVRAPQLRGVARVWPVPPLPVAMLALALWVVAWWLLARRARRGPLGWRLMVLAPSVLCAIAAYVIEDRLKAQDLVVIATSAPLRTLPALGADQGAVPIAGEVVRVRERRGVWLRLELDAQRAGWYPAERTYPLVRD